MSNIGTRMGSELEGSSSLGFAERSREGNEREDKTVAAH
jgi:hypothetical protein